jgi:hypothetical protein
VVEVSHVVCVVLFGILAPETLAERIVQLVLGAAVRSVCEWTEKMKSLKQLTRKY